MNRYFSLFPSSTIYFSRFHPLKSNSLAQPIIVQYSVSDGLAIFVNKGATFCQFFSKTTLPVVKALSISASKACISFGIVFAIELIGKMRPSVLRNSIYHDAGEDMTTDNIGKANQQPVVLLIDDEKVCLDVGIKMLHRLGFIVLAAQGGKEAVEIYEMNQEVVDLIILDMNMPYRGELTFRKLNLVDNKAKVLLTSGWCQDHRVKELLDRGCVGYIQKPFNLEVFSQNIEKALKN